MNAALKFFGFGLLAIGFSTSASAVTTLTLVQEPAQTVGPQSASAPCIIAGTTCQNPANFSYTNFQQTGNITAYDELSPTYTVSQFPFLTFDVAIDVNTANNGESLSLFEVWIGNVLAYNYVGPTAIANPLPSNGNGYGDWTLRSIDLRSYAANTQVYFRAAWTGASDGAESFFIVSRDLPCVPGTPGCGQEEVPEPGTLALLGLGLLGLGLGRRRK